MKLVLLALTLTLLPTLTFAQGRALGAGAILIDDGAGHSIRLMAPAGLGSAITDWTLPIPPPAVTAGFVQAGSLSNQYLMWNNVGSYWQATSSLLTLPFSQTASSGSPLWSLTQTGSGAVSNLAINNSGSNTAALLVTSNGTGTGISITLSNASNSGRGLEVLQAGVGPGVFATSAGGTALWGITSSISAAGVLGDNTYGEAVVGRNRGGNGVGAVVGRNDSSGYGVRGFNTKNGYGVLGQAGISGGTGTAGRFENVNAANTSDALSVATNSSGNAAHFIGNVVVSGNLTVSGTVSKGAGSFMIDHPLDPKNKILYHSFVESPDMKNIYDGVIMLDKNGHATVTMPDWFNALNADFRYQLTSIGAPGPGLYIAGEISGNTFEIAGGTPGTKVSWQVTGIRHDAYANAHRLQVEVDKSPELRGTYLHPDAYGVNDVTIISTPTLPAGLLSSTPVAAPQNTPVPQQSR
jgi:hypothetical protein